MSDDLEKRTRAIHEKADAEPGLNRAGRPGERQQEATSPATVPPKRGEERPPVASAVVTDLVVKLLDFAQAHRPAGKLSLMLDEMSEGFAGDGIDVRIVANDLYHDRVQELIDGARTHSGATSDPAYRLLQILTRVTGELKL